MKIEQLTPSQIEAMPYFVEKWLKIGLCTDPIDLNKAKAAVIKCYECAQLEPPTLFFKFDSPMSCAIAQCIINRDQVGDQVVGQVRDQVRDQVWDQVRDQVFGAHDAPWLAFYSFFNDLNIIAAPELDGLLAVAENCGWWAPYEGACFLQERPSSIRFDEQKRLHCETGPAISYRDGFAVYAWHGTRVEKDWIEHKEKLTPAIALDEKNVEKRRAACEIIGWSRILKELNAITIDKSENVFVGELLEVVIPDIGKERFLKVMCGTSREFALPVPPDMMSASQAQAWLNFTTEDMYLPQLRT